MLMSLGEEHDVGVILTQTNWVGARPPQGRDAIVIHPLWNIQGGPARARNTMNFTAYDVQLQCKLLFRWEQCFECWLGYPGIRKKGSPASRVTSSPAMLQSRPGAHTGFVSADPWGRKNQDSFSQSTPYL